VSSGKNSGLKDMLLYALIWLDRGGKLQKTGKVEGDQSQYQHTCAFNISRNSSELPKYVIIKYQIFLIDIY